MIKNINFGLAEALISLTPGAQWVLRGDTYDGLEWLDETQEQPTEEAVLAEIERLQEEYDALEYQRLRQPEYPPMTDYLDGVVKGDQAQIDAYIAACQAVKEKYPKPE
jgi:tRNA A37 N6-isopentenylltransferase MiaA